MSIDEITDRLEAGESVADVAATLGITPSAVYMQLRRAGKSARSLGSTGGRFTLLPSYPGYRINRAGQVQSCIAPRTGDQTSEWRDLRVRYEPRVWYYQFGASNGDRVRRSVRVLLKDAFGELLGEQLFDRFSASHDA